MRPTMLSHVDQALLHDADELAADFLREFNLLDLADEFRGNSSFAAKAFDRVGQEAEQTVRVYLEGFHLLHQFAELENLFAQELLYASEFAVDGGDLRRGLAAQNIELHLDADQ